MSINNNELKKYIKECSNIIKNGDLVVFPTETVYGIGADALNEDAVKKIFEVKNRPMLNPLILHISSTQMLHDFAVIRYELEEKLINKYWPGPLTIIFKKKEIVPNLVTANLDTVAIRMPRNEIALSLIKNSNTPIAAPSANVSGKPSGTNIIDIKNDLGKKVKYYIENGASEIGIESTVVKVDKDRIIILRPGDITLSELKSVTNNVEYAKGLNEKITMEKVESPGMKYKHYSPNTPCKLFYSDSNDKLIIYINKVAKKYKKPLIICNDVNKNNFIDFDVITYGITYKEIAKNIYAILRKVDLYNYDVALIEGIDEKDLGYAIMNRLIRTCNYNYTFIK